MGLATVFVRSVGKLAAEQVRLHFPATWPYLPRVPQWACSFSCHLPHLLQSMEHCYMRSAVADFR